MTATTSVSCSPERLEAVLGDLIASHDVCGATVAVLAAGEVVEASAGILHAGTAAPATPDSLFQIGSITKAWTATILHQLATAGHLDLRHAVRTYLPDLRFADHALGAQVSVGMLLSHTSGLEGDRFTDTGRGDDCLARYVDGLDDLRFVASPGQSFSYGNAGYAVAGRIAEVVTGERWDDLVRERIIEPLGLTHCALLPEEAILHPVAVGHERTPTGPRPVKTWALPRSLGPAGSTLAMTARDLLAFGTAHLEPSPHGVAPDIASAMQQRKVDLTEMAFTPGIVGWGSGWMLFEHVGHRIFGHDGGTLGQSAMLRVLPEMGVVVAGMANTVPGGTPVLRGVLDAVLGDLGVAPFEVRSTPVGRSTADADSYVGCFAQGDTMYHVERQGDGIALRIESSVAASDDEPHAEPLTAIDHRRFAYQPASAGDVWVDVWFPEAADSPRSLLFTSGRLARRVN
jgi:CubicO group peptidase (beta-lactamase class C family)